MAAHDRALEGVHDQELQEGARAVPQGHSVLGAAQGVVLPDGRVSAAAKVPGRVPGHVEAGRGPAHHGGNPQGPAPAVPLPRDVFG